MKINVELAMKTEIKTEKKTQNTTTTELTEQACMKRGRKKNRPPVSKFSCLWIYSSQNLVFTELMKHDWPWITENINFLTQGIFFLESLYWLLDNSQR